MFPYESSRATKVEIPVPYPSDSNELEVRVLGVVPYEKALERQARLVARRRAGEIPDQLLLLEHPHVITLGSGSSAEHVLADAAERSRLGIDLFEYLFFDEKAVQAA